MAEDSGMEIIRRDGTVVPLERRSPVRTQPTYPRSAGRMEGMAHEDRRRRRRVPDRALRGRVIDTLG